jgi:hypothetical protein
LSFSPPQLRRLAAAQQPDLPARVDRVFVRYDPNTPGCAVGVAKDGKPLCAQGLRLGESRVPHPVHCYDGDGEWIGRESVHRGGRSCSCSRTASSRSTTTSENMSVDM